MSKRKVIMLTDSSLTYPKVMSPDAQAVLKRLEAYGAETVYVQDQKDWDRSMFVEYASKVEKTGPEPFEVNPEFLKEAEEAEVIIANFAPVGSAVIKAGKNLKMIGVTRSGAENINIGAATEQGVKVAVAPGRLADPVSDYTVGLILAESRNIARMSITDHGGEWMTDAPNSSYIKSLKGATVGLVGYGIIGQRVAAKLQAFGCSIIAYDPFCRPEVFKDTNCRSVSLDELMKTSDYISIHARLTKDTQGLVTREHINGNRSQYRSKRNHEDCDKIHPFSHGGFRFQEDSDHKADNSAKQNGQLSRNFKPVLDTFNYRFKHIN